MTKDEGAKWLESRMGSDGLTEDTGRGKLRLRERVRKMKGTNKSNVDSEVY